VDPATVRPDQVTLATPFEVRSTVADDWPTHAVDDVPADVRLADTVDCPTKDTVATPVAVRSAVPVSSKPSHVWNASYCHVPHSNASTVAEPTNVADAAPFEVAVEVVVARAENVLVADGVEDNVAVVGTKAG